MEDRARKLVSDAQELQDSGELYRAGNTYTAAAHEYAGAETDYSFPEPNSMNGAVSRFRYAAICYRIVGDKFRAKNRCELGTRIAEDYIEYINQIDFQRGSFADRRRGAWPEYIGVLRTIAQQDDAAEAYDKAAEIYDNAGSWEFCMAEQEHMRLAGFFRNIRRGLGHDIPADALENRPLGPTFSEWLEYKRSRLPDLLDDLEAQGTWPVE